MRRFLTAVSVLAVVLYAADPARERTLQRAIDLMETKGDLGKAMPLFEDVSKSSDRALAARALLYLAQGQERQGADRARATYERIIQEFGNQTETVGEARKRLAALGSVRMPASFTKRLICGDCGYQDADFSNDGHSMLMTDWDTGDLAIRDLSTGRLNRLMVKSGSWQQSNFYAASPVYSPDQHQVAYCWEADKDAGPGLRVMDAIVGGKSLIVQSPPMSCAPAAWSPDGKRILVMILKRDKTTELAWVTVANGSLQVIKSLGWRLRNAFGQMKVSPDGRLIAYSALVTDPKTATGPVESTNQRVYILASDGASETELEKASGINKEPVWTPDGKHILFSSDRSGKFDLWSVAVDNGKALGTPELVLADNSSRANWMTRAGTYYYAQQQFGVEIIGITGTGAKFVGFRPTWSPDGKHLAFTRHRTIGGTDNFDLVVRSIETGEEAAYKFDGIKGVPPQWFHDGQSILVAVDNPGKTRGFYRVDLKTGEFRKIVEFDNTRGNLAALSPDDRTIYQEARDPKESQIKVDRILGTDVKTGQEKLVCTIPATGPARFALSPDGHTLAIKRYDPSARRIHIARVSTDGTDYRELHSEKGGPNEIANIAWDKDGRNILFGIAPQGKWQIMRIPAEGGTPEPAGFDLKDPGVLYNISLSPDGTRLAFSAAPYVRQLWAIDNLLPGLK